MAAVVAIGVSLRFWQWLGGASLWIDELAIAHNLVDRGLVDLLVRPLDYSQVAPVGFLALEWLVSRSLGTSEWALRLVPLLAGVMALACFARLARVVLDGWGAVAATAVFAFAPVMIRFSAMLKPYSADVAAVVLLTLVGLERNDARRRAWTAYVAVTLIVPWMSNAAVLALAGIAPLLFWQDLRRRARAPRVLVAAFAAAAASTALAAAWSSSLMDGDMLTYMQTYWASQFPPRSFGSLSDLLWPGRAFHEVSRSAFPEWRPGPGLPRVLLAPVVAAPALICLAGMWRVWRTDRLLAVVLAVPAVVLLAVSAAHLYPISRRLVLWLVPLFLLTFVAGLGVLTRRLPRGNEIRAGALFAMVLFAVWGLTNSPPVMRMQEYGPLMQDMRSRWNDGDVVLVYPAAQLGVAWYGARVGFDIATMLSSECSTGSQRTVLRELDRLRGQPRAWFIAGNLDQSTGELVAALAYLDTIGRRLHLIAPDGQDASGPMGAWAALYDLSDPSRLARTMVEAFKPPPPVGGGPPRWAPGYCGGPEAGRPNLFTLASPR